MTPIRKREIGEYIAKWKWRWVNAHMKRLLPETVYRDFKSGDPIRKAKALGWMQERGYHVEFKPDGTTIIRRGEKTIAQGRLVVDIKSPQALFDLAELGSFRDVAI
jgi:hypothetical protein